MGRYPVAGEVHRCGTSLSRQKLIQAQGTACAKVQRLTERSRQVGRPPAVGLQSLARAMVTQWVTAGEF